MGSSIKGRALERFQRRCKLEISCVRGRERREGAQMTGGRKKVGLSQKCKENEKNAKRCEKKEGTFWRKDEKRKRVPFGWKMQKERGYLLAGRFTPAASVEVQHRIQSTPEL